MFTDGESVYLVRTIQIVITVVVAIITIFQLFMLRRGLIKRKKSVNDGPEMKALIRFYYGIILSPLLVSSIAGFAADFPEWGSWVYPIIQLVLAIYYVMFLSLLVVSSGGWLRLRSLLRYEPDATRWWWSCLRWRNAW